MGLPTSNRGRIVCSFLVGGVNIASVHSITLLAAIPFPFHTSTLTLTLCVCCVRRISHHYHYHQQTNLTLTLTTQHRPLLILLVSLILLFAYVQTENLPLKMRCLRRLALYYTRKGDDAMAQQVMLLPSLAYKSLRSQLAVY